MFSEETNASKIAMVAMEERLRSRGCALFDVQLMTPHLRSMGAIAIPRGEYLRRLSDAIALQMDWSAETVTPSGQA